ncbi:MAG: hypothetical protein B7Y51_00685, partial [Burkholderiales bacterium 28-67-8]
MSDLSTPLWPPAVEPVARSAATVPSRVAAAPQPLVGPTALAHRRFCGVLDLAEARRIAAACRGGEVENTIPKVMRAQPFVAVNSMVGPNGERWVPIHGVLTHEKTVPFHSAFKAMLAARTAPAAT